ncbi:matrixin family metalloprotease [Nannocystis pusilla]|uniref:Matrixin family metalloprotease n=1 Tax=Nannocystis pusilla TaxID=889268 RepID=A0ABS7TXN6_9BACT|nr:matrixin family metalloprotease [Nannocystis pusilla]MBZ5713018.1 matrixin family metalloprotease [Nannocystis pusilla]
MDKQRSFCAVLVGALGSAIGSGGCELEAEDEVDAVESPSARGPEPNAVINQIVIEASVTQRHQPVWISKTTRAILDTSSSEANSASAVLWTPYTLTIQRVISGNAMAGATIGLWIPGGKKGDFLSGENVTIDYVFGHEHLTQGQTYNLTLVAIPAVTAPTGCVSCPTLPAATYAAQMSGGVQFPAPLDIALPGCPTWDSINTPLASALWGNFTHRVSEVDPAEDPDVVNLPSKVFALHSGLGSSGNDCDMATPVTEGIWMWEEAVYWNDPNAAWSRISMGAPENSNCNFNATDQVNCIRKGTMSIPVPCANPMPGQMCAAAARTHINAPWNSALDRATYTDTDIEINVTDFDFRWGPCHTPPFQSNYDLNKVIAHEVGHAWGLDHRNCGEDLMRADGLPAQMNARWINEEDVRRIELLYPYEKRCPTWDWLEYESCWCNVNTGCVHI